VKGQISQRSEDRGLRGKKGSKECGRFTYYDQVTNNRIHCLPVGDKIRKIFSPDRVGEAGNGAGRTPWTMMAAVMIKPAPGDRPKALRDSSRR